MKASVDKLAEHLGVGERAFDVCCGAVGVYRIVYPVGDRCQEPVDLFDVGCRLAAARELAQQGFEAVDVSCNVLTGSAPSCFQSLDVLLELLSLETVVASAKVDSCTAPVKFGGGVEPSAK